MLPVLVAAFVVFCLTVDGFTSAANLGNMARLFAPLFVAAVGAMFVFLLGEIDLSDRLDPQPRLGGRRLGDARGRLGLAGRCRRPRHRHWRRRHQRHRHRLAALPGLPPHARACC